MKAYLNEQTVTILVMCHFLKLMCAEHNHILGTKVILCKSGLKGELCLNSVMAYPGNDGKSIQSNTYQITKKTPSITAALLENIIMIKVQVVECFMYKYISKGMDVETAYDRYLLMKKDPNMIKEANRILYSITLKTSSVTGVNDSMKTLSMTSSIALSESISQFEPNDEVLPTTVREDQNNTSSVSRWIETSTIVPSKSTVSPCIASIRRSNSTASRNTYTTTKSNRIANRSKALVPMSYTY